MTDQNRKALVQQIGKARIAAAAVLGLIAGLLALQGGFVFALEFVREYQDSTYWLVGTRLILLATLVSLVPAINLASSYPTKRISKSILISATIVFIPALIGAVVAVAVE